MRLAAAIEVEPYYTFGTTPILHGNEPAPVKVQTVDSVKRVLPPGLDPLDVVCGSVHNGDAALIVGHEN